MVKEFQMTEPNSSCDQTKDLYKCNGQKGVENWGHNGEIMPNVLNAAFAVTETWLLEESKLSIEMSRFLIKDTLGIKAPPIYKKRRWLCSFYKIECI